MSAGASAPPPAASDGYERRDVRLRPLVIAAVVLALSFFALFGVAWLLGSYFAARQARESPRPNLLAERLGPQVPPEPRLQSAPLQDLLDLRTQEDAVLNHYGWVDRPAGIVHIPIARAMDLLAQRQPPAMPHPAGEGQ